MKKRHFYALATLLMLFILLLWRQGPVPQRLTYHDFADQRTLWGIPNFWNVVSNLPMLFLGLFGLGRAYRRWSWRPDFAARWIPVLLSGGIVSACFGSALYHAAPDNASLVWDRLPMTFMFMPLFALLIYKFVGREAGALAFYLLVPLGVFSVWYWQHTEALGRGDLRFYIFVQYFPMLIAPFLLWLSAERPAYIRYVLLLLGWYVLAKMFEHNDLRVFNWLGFWSGHTIKHLLAAVSLFYVLKLVAAWERELKRGGGMSNVQQGMSNVEVP